MGFLKSFAQGVSDVVDVELKILPDLITAVAPPGIPQLFAGAVLGVTPRSLASITKQSFEGEGLTIEQQRAVNFVRDQQGLPLVGKFGQPLRGFVEVLARSDFERAVEAAKIQRGPGSTLGSARPQADPAFLLDNPFLTGTPSNLSVRIPDSTIDPVKTPRTGGGLRLTVQPTAVPPSRAVTISSPVTAPLKEKPMGSFFETLGDRLLAGGEDIFKGFVTGGISGGLSAGAQALLETGGTPAGFGGVPPRIARAQAETRGMLTGLSPLPPTVGGIRRVGFGTAAGPIAALGRFFPTPITSRVLGLGAGAVGAGAVFKKVPPISTAGFRKPGGFPPGIPPQGTRLFMGGGGPAGFRGERFGETSLGIVEGGKMAGQSNFAKDECNRTLKFFCSPRPGEGWVNVDDAAALGLKARKPFARFNIMENRFQSIPRRRMNVANLKALGRAERRRRDFMDLVLPLVRDRRKESAGLKPRLVVAKKRKKRRKVA